MRDTNINVGSAFNGLGGCLLAVALAVGLPLASLAGSVVDVSGVGAMKKTVAISVANADFASSLRRNLELSGLFLVKPEGAIRVSGTPGVSVSAAGAGKQLTLTAPVSDATSARMAARQLSDAMCMAYGGQKGFACDRIVFVSKGVGSSEVCTCYPDGGDVMQLTHDGVVSFCPRWKDHQAIYYVGYPKRGGQQIYELNLATGSRKLAWNIRGVSSPAVVSPDGSRVAIVASFQGNPELYVIQGSSLVRLTRTPLASEGQPSWSPDGKSIVYVSDETRHPQLYVIDVATKAKRRLTSRGTQNVDPDWGRDGRIAYITKRGGAQVAVLEPAEGDRTAKLVTDAGNWEHPSWSRDGRSLVASCDSALFAVDTAMVDGAVNKPVQVFRAKGCWTAPTWLK